MNKAYELERVISKSELSCNIMDLLKGKVPKNLIKQRILRSQLLFINMNTNSILYPSKITRLYDSENPNVFFYESKGKVDEKINKVNVELNRKKGSQDVKIKNFQVRQLITSFENRDILEILFTNLYDGTVHEANSNILTYFINKNDFDYHNNFLKKHLLIN